MAKQAVYTEPVPAEMLEVTSDDYLRHAETKARGHLELAGPDHRPLVEEYLAKVEAAMKERGMAPVSSIDFDALAKEAGGVGKDNPPKVTESNTPVSSAEPDSQAPCICGHIRGLHWETGCDGECPCRKFVAATQVSSVTWVREAVQALLVRLNELPRIAVCFEQTGSASGRMTEEEDADGLYVRVTDLTEAIGAFALVTPVSSVTSEPEWFVIKDTTSEFTQNPYYAGGLWVADIRAATWYSREEGERVLANVNEIDAEGVELTRVPDGYIPDDPGNDL